MLVERVSMAVPETFAALASLVGGVVTLPASLISWGGKISPMLPLIQNVLLGKVSKEDLGDGCKKLLDGWNDIYENTLIPALFVALTVDTIFSFAMGWIFWDFERMLHASTIALPGAFLAAQQMWATTERGYSLRT